MVWPASAASPPFKAKVKAPIRLSVCRFPEFFWLQASEHMAFYSNFQWCVGGATRRLDGYQPQGWEFFSAEG